MECIGIWVDPETTSALINPQLMIDQGRALIEHNVKRVSPEMLRLVVQNGLRKISPTVVVTFWDHEEEEEMEVVDRDYSLLIQHGLPQFSRSKH